MCWRARSILWPAAFWFWCETGVVTMQNYRILLQYDGTRYAGWQRQGNTSGTIQGKLEELLSRLCEEPVEVAGAGRTDAGVHASGQVANFKLKESRDPVVLLSDMNRFLPEDIAVLEVTKAPPRFHSRLNAKGKTYVYRIWNSPVPNVFERRFLTQIPERLDEGAMDLAAAKLCGTHDFRAFCSLKRYKKSTIRTLTDLTVERIGSEVRIQAQGDGFLYNMVRILAGTLIEIGLGSRGVSQVEQILQSADRQQAGYTAPPQGLILQEVHYGEPAGKDWILQ